MHFPLINEQQYEKWAHENVLDLREKWLDYRSFDSQIEKIDEIKAVMGGWVCMNGNACAMIWFVFVYDCQ